MIDKTGEKFSLLQQKKDTFINEPYVIFCLSMERSALYKRIDKRVEKMLDQGLLKEAKELLVEVNEELE